MPWHVLAGGGGFAGRRWTILNSAPRDPREAIVGLHEEPYLYPSKDAAAADVRRVETIHGAKFRPEPVAFVGSGKDTKISQERKTVDLRPAGGKR